MKFSLAVSVFLTAVAHAANDVNSVARSLVSDDAGLMHVGRDGVLRSFTRDLEVIDAVHVERNPDSAISARDMFHPSEDIVNDVRSLREVAAKKAKRDPAGLLEKRCGSGYCSSTMQCSMNDEQACQICYGTSCRRPTF